MGRAIRRRRRSPSAIIDAAKGIRFDLGCGEGKEPGWVGMDVRDVPGVDIVHSMYDIPWPVPDNACLVVMARHVWEHVKPWETLNVMAEIHRISRPNGIVLLSGPYGIGYRYVQDPTHCNPINDIQFHYWDPLSETKLWEVYKPPPLHLEAFHVLAAGADRDFEAALKVCKGKCTHGRT